DEMPDVARRFAAAFELLNNRTATLPLTGFALPDGLPFDVMGSLPAEDSDGRIGLVSALEQAAQLYKDRKSDATEQSRKLVAAIQSKLTSPSSGTNSPEISESTLPAQGVRRALYEMVDSAS